jgi:dihydrofolate reductase
MRKLVESTFVTLDGVISSPERLGAAYWDDEHHKYASDLLFEADALLLGRATYEAFAQSWPSLSDDYSDRINSLPKHVASTTLREATWNASVIDGDLADAVANLKSQPGKNILKFGTGEVDQTLVEHNQVDEFHFWLFPVAVGIGERLLDGTTTTLELVRTTTFASGIVVLTYAPK